LLRGVVQNFKITHRLIGEEEIDSRKAAEVVTIENQGD